jgi:DNA-binding response OmpR family regulator
MREKRALVCDDDAGIRTLVRTIVQREGFDVDVAANGREGLEKVRQGCYDLLVLDLMMPEIDGSEMLREMKQAHNATVKRVIFMTAATEAVRSDEPICTLLPKPFDVDALTAAVRKCARDCSE